MMGDKFDKIKQEDLEKVTGGIGNTDLCMLNDAESEMPNVADIVVSRQEGKIKNGGGHKTVPHEIACRGTKNAPL